MAMNGTVRWFDNTKGYGFIGSEDGQDVFVHYSSIVGLGYRTLEQGEPVTFEIIEGRQGPQADNVIKTRAKVAAP
jgi:CspA family cold shock protein